MRGKGIGNVKPIILIPVSHSTRTYPGLATGRIIQWNTLVILLLNDRDLLLNRPQLYEQNDEEETLPSVDRHLYSQQDGTHTLYSPTRSKQEVRQPRRPYENVVNETGI